MDFERISPKTFVGQLLRLPLRLIPPDMKMPILRGKIRGKRWTVKAGRHGCWLGTYEYEKQIIFEKMVKPGDTVFDIGAQAGFYTLLASVIVGPTGRVFAFEPLPRNVFYLKEHLALNSIKNVTVIEAAVSNSSGVAFFKDSASGYQGFLSSEGEVQVNTVSLDELIASGQIPLPDCIKMDIEGGEARALAGAKSLLEREHPKIFLAAHGRPMYRQCAELLQSCGSQIEVIDWNGVGEVPNNPDVLASYKGAPSQSD